MTEDEKKEIASMVLKEIKKHSIDYRNKQIVWSNQDEITLMERSKVRIPVIDDRGVPPFYGNMDCQTLLEAYGLRKSEKLNASASASAEQAKQSESKAVQAAANAKESEENALSAADRASESEVNAQASETEARAKAEAASSSAVLAGQKADEASNSAAIATSSASSAIESKEAADSAKEGAIAAKNSAETLKSEMQQSLDSAIEQAISAISLNMHPVGSYYISDKEDNPGSLFGGTWESVKDVMLIGAGNKYVAGSTGGNAAHTLSKDEMPSHNHGESGGHTHSRGTMNITGYVYGDYVRRDLNVTAGGAFYKDDYNASILGLYGQNGSGKTALIDVLELLKNCLCGTVIDSRYADYININADISTVCIDFSLRNGTECIPVSYEFSIKAGSDDSQQNTGIVSDIEGKKTVIISDEIIRCPVAAGSGAKKGRMMDTSSDIFSPFSKKILLVGKDSNIDTDLIVAKKLAKVQSRSFLFSRELLSLIRRRAELKSGNAAEQKEADYYISVLESLVNFGNHGLFVINTATSGLISLDAQPISFKYSEENMGALGTIMLSLDRSQLIQKQGLEIVKKVIGNMNTVLCRIVPGLTVGIKELGTEVMPDGNVGCRIQLMSEKNSKEIPLKYESKGIKKIISILQLLIVIYNQDSITVAIDELDSGVFEYLLGEILRIISEKGKGQLIFTSHNLRPLETLDKSFIAFTTNNPRNRYVRMQNVKENNNLRDFYYRSITLGTQKEELYEPTKNADIAFAFREAGVNGCK